jgi:hypothetical protein
VVRILKTLLIKQGKGKLKSYYKAENKNLIKKKSIKATTNTV